MFRLRTLNRRTQLLNKNKVRKIIVFTLFRYLRSKRLSMLTSLTGKITVYNATEPTKEEKNWRLPEGTEVSKEARTNELIDK